MPETNIGAADRSDLKTQFGEDTELWYEVAGQTTDAAADQPETYWTNPNWTQYLGYYKTIPELTAAIDAKATWTVGKGFTADPITELLLMTIKGWGKDTFNTILENCVRTYHIGGDSFCEIITDKDGVLINLKPLDPSVIRIVANRKGRILRYEQLNKVKRKIKKFQPEDIFHLARNRVADEIHGVSIITAIENIILMRNEAMADWRRVLHRNVDPLMIFHLDTDDASRISAFKAKMDAAKGKGENMYIPKGAVVPEQLSMAPNSSLNPLPWIEQLSQYFWQATGVPDIIVGSSKSLTEAATKIAYLAFQQTIEEEQLFIEEQVLSQLNLVIELTFPASLESEMLSDKPKVEERGIEKEQAVQPNDVTAEMEGRK